MGWSPIRNILNTVENVVEAVVDPVSDALADFEDGVRKVVEPVVEAADDALANPYVRLVASIAYPPAAPYLNAYAKLDSGENLNAADIAALGVGAASDLGGVTIDPNIAKAVETGAKIADGADPLTVLTSAYGDEIVGQLGLEDSAKTAFANTFGDETLNILEDNMDYARAGFDIATGKDPSQVIADRFGQDIVDRMGVGDPAGYAALKTAVALDQGVDSDEALLAGGEEYYKRGGELPDYKVTAELAGIDIPDLGSIDFIKNAYGSLGLGDAPDLAFIEDFVRTNTPDLSVGDIDLSGFKATDLGLGSWEEIASSGINLEGVDFSGIDVPDIDFDLSFPDFNFGSETAIQPAQIVASQQEQTDEEGIATQDTLPIDELLLADFALKNPFLRG